MQNLRVVVFILAGVVCNAHFSAAQKSNNPFKFRDVASESGLLPDVSNIYGHGAAWGDVDGDGWIDLYVGTFSKGDKHNIFFRNINGKFKADSQTELRIRTRTTGAVFADFDNDGGADLYV